MSILLGTLVAILMATRGYIVSWLSERSDGPIATTEEIKEELWQNFGPKDELEFVTLQEHMDPILDALGEQYTGGFTQKQLEMLRYRMDNQTPGISRSATYPVIFAGEECDLEMEWIVNNDRIHIRICGPEGSLEPVRDAVVHSPARLFSDSLVATT